jgi:hypothetical protein
MLIPFLGVHRVDMDDVADASEILVHVASILRSKCVRVRVSFDRRSVGQSVLVSTEVKDCLTVRVFLKSGAPSHEGSGLSLVEVCKFPYTYIHYMIIFRETGEGRGVLIGTSSGANRDNEPRKLCSRPF